MARSYEQPADAGIAEDEPLSDLPDRINQHGTDDEGRRLVNGHGDVDVVRTPEGRYPVQLPLEYGAHVTIDGKTEVFTGFRKDSVSFVDTDEYPLDDDLTPVTVTHEGIHAFNTRVRDADEVSVEYPESDE